LVMLFSLVSLKKPGIYLVARGWAVIVGVIVIFGTALPFFSAGGSIDIPIADVLGRNQTFTGRTVIWAKLVPFFEQSPILGYGFGGFWNSATQEVAYGVKEAHNGYLALCLELGGVGLLLTAVFLAAAVRKAQRALVHDPDWGILSLGLLLMLVVHNISESSINSLQRHLTGTLLLVSVVVSVERGSPLRRRQAASGRANHPIGSGPDRSLARHHRSHGPVNRNLLHGLAVVISQRLTSGSTKVGASASSQISSARQRLDLRGVRGPLP
jgi:O-antigen ligase